MLNNNKKKLEKEKTIKSSEHFEHSEDFIFRLPLFSVCLCHLQLKSSLILKLFAMLLGYILKILLFLVFCMVCCWSSVTCMGVLTPIHWE